MANNNNSETYSVTKQNTFRLICILIDDATSIVNKNLERNIKRNFSTIENFFNVKRNEINACQHLNSLQKQKILPSGNNGRPTNSVSNFDLSLSIAIFQNFICLNPNFDNCYESGSSTASHLKRLRNIRNKLYAHLHTIGLDDKELIRLEDTERRNLQYQEYSALAKLEKSIYGLCLDQNEENHYKTLIKTKLKDPLEPNKIESFKAKFENLIINDRISVLEIMKNISEKVIGENKSSNKHLTDLQKKMETFQNAFNEEKNNSASLLNKIFDTIHNQKLISNMMLIIESNEEIKNKLTIINNEVTTVKETSNEIVKNQMESISQLNNIQSSIQSSNASTQNINKNVSVLIDTTNEINQSQAANESRLKNIESNIKNRFESIELNDFKELVLDEKKLYYKILILCAQNLREEKLDKRDLSEIIGSMEWDIIVDLDYEAREPNIGLADLICNSIQLRKDYMVKTYLKLPSLTDNEINTIKNGECCLYYLPNGCKNTEINKPEKFVRSAMIFRSFLNRFLSEIKYKQILCCSLIASDLESKEYDELLARIESMNKNVSEATVESGADNDIIFVGIAPKDFNRDIYKLNNIFQIENVTVESRNLVSNAPASQFLTSLSIFKSKKNVDDLEIPGLQNFWKFPRSKYSIYSSSFEIYHINIGKLAEHTDIELRNRQIEFLKGNEITPTEIYINDVLNKTLIKYPTYIERDLMSSIETEIDNHIKTKSNFFNLRIVKILHESSAGGTTLGRVLLFKLHNKVPCIKINSLEEEHKLYALCSTLSEESQLPLVLLIDEGDFSGEQIIERKLLDLSESLSASKIIRSLIIYVKHIPFVSADLYKQITKKQTNQTVIKTFELKAELSNNEDSGFENLHKHLGLLKEQDWPEKPRLIYWYGLAAFGGEYKGARALVDFYLKFLEENTNSDRIFKIMYLISFYYVNTGEKFPFNLVASFLNIKVAKLYKNFKCEDDGNYLPLYKLFILKEEYNTASIRPIHKAIAELIIKKKPNRLDIERDRKEQFELFYEIYLELLGLNPIDFYNELKQITAFLFILSKNEDIDKYYTVFIIETKILFGDEWTRNKLKAIYEKVKNLGNEIGPTIGSLLARFIFHMQKNKEEGICLMRKFLGLSNKLDRSSKITENWNQSQLLTIFGDFLRLSLDENHKLERNVEIANEAIVAYNKAQTLPYKDILSNNKKSNNSGLMNRYPYIGECTLRMKLLEMFNNQLIANRKSYNKEIVKNDIPDVIKESEDKIMIILDKIEMLQESKRFNINEDIEFDIHKMKIKLIEMRLDLENRPSIQKILLDYPQTVQLHVFDVVRLIEEQRSNVNLFEKKINKKTWEDIAQRKEIIESIINRCKLQVDKSNFPHYVSYRDLINAFINCQIHNDLKNKNTLDLAIIYALKWAKDYSEEPDPYFYLGMFNMIDGIDKNDPEILKTAMNHFSKCKEKYNSNKRFYGYRKLAYLYAKGPGLSSLIPFKEDCNINKLKEFSGRLLNDNIPLIKINNIIPAYYSKRNDDIETLNDEAQREKPYSFYVVFARDKIQMWKPKEIKVE